MIDLKSLYLEIFELIYDLQKSNSLQFFQWQLQNVIQNFLAVNTKELEETAYSMVS